MYVKKKEIPVRVPTMCRIFLSSFVMYVNNPCLVSTSCSYPGIHIPFEPFVRDGFTTIVLATRKKRKSVRANSEAVNSPRITLAFLLPQL